MNYIINMHENILFLTLFLTIYLSHAMPYHRYDLSGLNFVVNRTIGGKQEIRVAHNGVLTVEERSLNPEFRSISVTLVTDGDLVLKFINSENNTIENCEIHQNQPTEVNNLLSIFLDKETIELEDLNEETLLLHLQHNSPEFSYQSLSSNTKFIQNYKQLLDTENLMKKCIIFKDNFQRNLDRHNSNMTELVVSSVKVSEARKKRAIYPNTNWCGMGDRSLSFDDLGESGELDKCCREHDFCRYIIPTFTTRWGHLNLRFTTISHCDCDDRLNTCLREVKSKDSDAVGDLFFNHLKTPCFLFKKKQICTHWFLWTCIEYTEMMSVIIQEPMSFVIKYLIPGKT